MKRILAAALAAILFFPSQAAASGCVSTASVRVMPNDYWETVAVCESSLDGTTARWDDGGRWAGGLGIYIGTWIRYGGRQFARTPGTATKQEQIVVANRIATLGFTYKSGRYKHPVGYFGWGCIKKRKSLHPERWKHKTVEVQKCRKLNSREVDYKNKFPM